MAVGRSRGRTPGGRVSGDELAVPAVPVATGSTAGSHASMFRRVSRRRTNLPEPERAEGHPGGCGGCVLAVTIMLTTTPPSYLSRMTRGDGIPLRILRQERSFIAALDKPKSSWRGAAAGHPVLQTLGSDWISAHEPGELPRSVPTSGRQRLGWRDIQAGAGIRVLFPELSRVPAVIGPRHGHIDSSSRLTQKATASVGGPFIVEGLEKV